MKAYKLIKKYPSLPVDWEVGMFVGTGDRGDNADFSPCNGKYTNKYISYEEVTKNSHLWEIVDEQKFLEEYSLTYKDLVYGEYYTTFYLNFGYFTFKHVKRSIHDPYFCIRHNDNKILEVSNSHVTYKQFRLATEQEIQLHKSKEMYEILTLCNRHGFFIKKSDNEYINQDGLVKTLDSFDNYDLYSVRRLSDGEIFSVDDEVYKKSDETGQSMGFIQPFLRMHSYDFVTFSTNKSSFKDSLNIVNKVIKVNKNNSPIKTFKHKKTGEIGIYQDGVFKTTCFALEIGVEPSSLFWEEIIELPKKEFEILSFTDGFNIYNRYNDKFSINLQYYYREEELLNNPNCNIRSVKRLSDGEIFIIGDKIEQGTISKIYTSRYNTGIYLDTENYIGLPLKKWLKNFKYFTTEDGVDIYEGDLFYATYYYDSRLKFPQRCVASKSFNKNIWKNLFSTKELAYQYINMYNKTLSVNDVLSLTFPENVDMNELKNKLLEIINKNGRTTID